jgi:methyl-accepting chemotaxis protein
MYMLAIIVQTDARVVEALERIATYQLTMTILMVVALLMLAGGFFMFREIRRLQALVRETLDDMKPRMIPLIDRAKSITDDMAGMTDNVRRKVDDVLHTVEDVRRSVQEGAAATEDRVRRLGRVLDVVQDETEDLLLDAAATARGVHTTARALRRGSESKLLRRRRRPKRRKDE